MLSDEELAEYLDSKITSLLQVHGIYDIGNYGWISEDTMDPESLGHAMWQTSPPLETDWEFLLGNGPPKHRPTKIEELLIVAGHDFEGLMKASRLSIGLTLFYQSVAEKHPLSENQYFWLHNADAIFHLNMASDRAREYFVLSFFNESVKVFNNRGGKHSWYVYPFTKLVGYYESMPVGDLVKSAIAPLPNIANRIFKYRERRNFIVHDIATKLGETNNNFIRKQQQAYDTAESPKTQILPTFEEVKRLRHEVECNHREELDKASTLIKDWYVLLVMLSNKIFEAEYWLRKIYRF